MLTEIVAEELVDQLHPDALDDLVVETLHDSLVIGHCSPFGRRAAIVQAPGRGASIPGAYNRRVDLDVVFLGTSGSMPTARRAPTALLVRRGGERFLVDCAEGTQRQLLRSAVGLVDLGEIFLTHYHADHYLGLPGMLKTFALRGREVPLTVFGPRGLHELFGALRRIFGKPTYPLELHELDVGDVLARAGYRIE